LARQRSPKLQLVFTIPHIDRTIPHIDRDDKLKFSKFLLEESGFGDGLWIEIRAHSRIGFRSYSAH